MPPFRLTLILTALPLLPLTATGLLAQDSDTANPAAEQGALPSMQEVEQAWQRGDYVYVRQSLQALAEQTDSPLAQYRYGRVLLEGRGGPVDIPAAVTWLERAVAQNHIQASTLLARVYLSGTNDGPARDPVRAAELFNGAAARGNTEAQYYMGLLYRQGTGVDRDLKAAFNWFLAAAEDQHRDAQYELARAYSRGEGTEVNPTEGRRWLESAASEGHSEAQFFMGYALDTGQGAEKNPTAALEWFRRSAEGGYVVAQRWLGRKYLTGEGVQPNPNEAMRWLIEAARNDDVEAFFLLGNAYSGGLGVETDLQKAWNMYERASGKGYPPATIAMAKMLEKQQGDDALAQVVNMYRKAAEQGGRDAVLYLGKLAGTGQLNGLAPPHLAVPWAIEAASEGDTAALDWVRAQAERGLRPARTAYGLWLLEIETDPAAAVGFLRPAAEAGDVEAQFQMGLLLTKGDGLEQDYVQAHAWLNIAATGGHAEAAKKRGVIGDLMTPEQLAEAQRVARAFFDHAASAAPVGQTE